MRKTLDTEIITPQSCLVGEWRDIIHYKDGRVKIIEGENIITDGLKRLIAALLKNDPRYDGITYWAIGDGNAVWDIPRTPQIFQLTFTDPVTIQGYAVLNLNTTPYSVLLTLGMTNIEVCDTFAAINYPTWSVRKLSNNTLEFTSTSPGNRTQGTSYDPLSTGAQATLSLVQEGNATSYRPQPAPTDVALAHEFTRKRVDLDNINYINEQGNPVTEPTDILEVYVVFDETEALGIWREFGIYGGTATDELNSGQMINHKIHGIIDKSTDLMVIERRIRFTFR